MEAFTLFASSTARAWWRLNFRSSFRSVAAKTLHLGDDTGQDSSTDRDLASEGTLLVNVVSIFGLIGDLEAKAGVAEKPGLGWLQSSLLVEEDGGLLLISPFGLIGHNWVSCRSESSNISL